MNPYLPNITKELRKSLGLDWDPSFNELDKSLLENKIVKLGEIKPLFSKVEPEIIEKLENKLKEV